MSVLRAIGRAIASDPQPVVDTAAWLVRLARRARDRDHFRSLVMEAAKHGDLDQAYESVQGVAGEIDDFLDGGR